ncbi:uncharacterized protein LOC144907177 [Branchiostoma floridae x Branchiostoma belcheri]
MHGLMKVVFGPRVSKTAPLKTKDGEIITDKAKQLDRWVQHYAELYSEETPERPELEEVLPTYPEMTELDSMPEESELLEALSSLPSGKAPGQDGIPGEVLKQNKELVISFHEDMEACIQFDGSTSAHFDIKKGVKQGCVLAPTLFSIYFAALLRFAFDGSHDGIYIRSRTDGSLFNLARLRAKTKTVESLLRDLLFADDAALVSHKEAGLQGHINNLAKACDLFSLTISVKKTEVMGQGTTVPPVIMLNGNALKSVEKFTYLGSVMTNNLSLDQELNVRIGKAAAAYGKLTKRDVCRSTLKDFSIQEKTWEQLAVDRNRWRAAVTSGMATYKASREEKAANARRKRKERQ